MDLEKKERINGLSNPKLIFNEKKLSKLDMLEIWANTVNHALIAIVSFYITWYCLHEKFAQYQNYHMYFASMGYQLFMSEGIMAMYNKNTYTMFLGSRQCKIWVHVVLQTIGSGFVMFAVPFEIYKRESLGRDHFGHYHNVIGEFLQLLYVKNRFHSVFFTQVSYRSFYWHWQ